MVIKNIALEIEVYTRLEGFRGKRETFSEAVDRLLTMLEKVGELRDVLEGQIAFKRQMGEQGYAAKDANR